jgi:hypothetical protein
MSEPSPSARPDASLLSRIIVTVTAVALSLMLSFLCALALVGWFPKLRDAVAPLVSDEQTGITRIISIVALLVLLAGPAWIIILGIKRRWLSGRQVGVLAGLSLVACVYLAWDDPIITRPLTVDEFSPVLPGDEASFEVLMRYERFGPLAKNFRDNKVSQGVLQPEQEAAWKKFVQTNRAAIEQDHAALAAVDTWWKELDTYARIGDLMVPGEDARFLAFQPLRNYSQNISAHASLLALDGQGDAALAELRSLYSVAHKIEGNSRSLARAMIAVVIQHTALRTAAFVLDQTPASPAAELAFGNVLTSGVDARTGVRRVLLMTHVCTTPRLISTGTGVIEQTLWHYPLLAVNGLVINPRATQNLIGDHYYELAALAEARDLTQFGVRTREFERDLSGGDHLKNLGGRILASQETPAFIKVASSYWATEDARVALVCRLQSPTKVASN